VTVAEPTVGYKLGTLAYAAKRAEDASGEIHTAVMEAKAAGASWEDIGEALGTSKQSAWERFVADWNIYREERGL
jgi:hypothetical protein